VALVGAPGSGKTLLLKLLNRLIEPSSGRVYLNGQLTSSFAIAQLRQQVMLLLAEPSVLGMSAEEALLYPLQLQTLSRSEQQNRLFSSLEELEIPQAWLALKAFEFSDRQRQWVAIARALIAQPKVLLLDCPLQHLTPTDAERLKTVLIQRSQTQQMGLLAVDSDWEWLANVSTRYLGLVAGQLHTDCHLPYPKDWQAIQAIVNQATDSDDW
jgi:D-methionine transport system ATP-binding protein